MDYLYGESVATISNWYYVIFNVSRYILQDEMVHGLNLCMLLIR